MSPFSCDTHNRLGITTGNIVPVFKKKNLRFREVMCFAQVHTGTWGRGEPGSRVMSLMVLGTKRAHYYSRRNTCCMVSLDHVTVGLGCCGGGTWRHWMAEGEASASAHSPHLLP